MVSSSTSEFTLNCTSASPPARAIRACSSIRSTSPERTPCGATSSRRKDRCRLYPVSTLNRSVTSAPTSGSAVSMPKSSYSRAVFGW